ncbi:MAG: LysR family transcriptional regulator [Rhodobacterales bacterium]|nr:LysR family transcriptional regulator [Rhodobacterales bacterium]
MGLDLRQLRYFREIVARGSITRAAAALRVAQPALSLQVKAMEQALGTRLLIRGQGGVTPTEAGALLAARAQAILDDLARAEDEVRSLGGDPAGMVRLGLPGTIGGIVALPLIEAARGRHPRITLTIAEAMSGFVADWLEQGRVDLGVLYVPPRAVGVASDPLLEEELVVLAPAADTDLPAQMALADLRGRRMVLPGPAHGLRALVDAALLDQGFAPQIAVEVDSYSSIKSLVAAGYGLSILPRHALRDDLARGRLRAVRIADPGLWRRVHLACPTRRPMTPAQQAIRDLLRDVVAGLVQSGAWGPARPVIANGRITVAELLDRGHGAVVLARDKQSSE